MMAQLDLLEQPEPRRERVASHLAQPFDREEARVVDGLYRENRKLVRCFAVRLRGRFGSCMNTADVESCVGVAFLKAWRAYDPARGAFSSIFWRFALGECLHWIKASNFSVAAPQRVRARGAKARRLLHQGGSPEDVIEELGCTAEQLRDALAATAGIAHDQMGFDLHASRHLTPWEALEAEAVAVW